MRPGRLLPCPFVTCPLDEVLLVAPTTTSRPPLTNDGLHFVFLMSLDFYRLWRTIIAYVIRPPRLESTNVEDIVCFRDAGNSNLKACELTFSVMV